MKHVAVDIGASGGTVFAGHIEEGLVELCEVTRFDNRPVNKGNQLVWDTDRLLSNILNGIRLSEKYFGAIDTVGIDTWGLDFGLIEDGRLLRDPISYRDPSTIETREAVLETIGKRRIFEETGISNWDTPNTLWQLHALKTRNPKLLERADELLMMPQLLAYLLGADPVGETTIASTTQMFDPHSRDWARPIPRKLGLPVEIFPDVCEPGKSIGQVQDGLLETSDSNPRIVLPPSHDTASAVAGLPLSEDAAFLSSGSWFILGTVLEKPRVSTAAFEAGMSNELGVDGTIRLLQNIRGFLLFEDCRTTWQASGKPYKYETLFNAALPIPIDGPLVNPDSDVFNASQHTPNCIREFCEETGQPVPSTQKAITQCLFRSLIAKTAIVFQQLSRLLSGDLSEVYLGGGAARNDWFCQLLADGLGRTVRTGPVESTAIGNLLGQAVSVGDLTDYSSGHRLIESELDLSTYQPRGKNGWDAVRRRMQNLID